MGNTKRDNVTIDCDVVKNFISEFSVFGSIKINQHKLKPYIRGHQEA